MVLRDSSKREKLVEETVRFWSSRTGEQVSLDDASEMIQNVSEFFGILKRWQQQKNEEFTPGDHKIGRKHEHERIFGIEDNAAMPKI